MPKYAVVEKAVGETPLEALAAFRAALEYPETVPLSYAGRLDPMASGKLLILCGDECKKRNSYDSLDKEYEFEVLFGCSTDTGDLLGLAQAVEEKERYSLKKLSRIAADLRGAHTVPYPVFSSKTVAGIPLFEYALRKKLHEIIIPTTSMRIFALKCDGLRAISGEQLLEKILSKIVTLQSDGFRAEEIGAQWSTVLDQPDKKYAIAKFRAVVGSGTYIRTLASMIAKRVGTDGVAYSIHRTTIGNYQPFFAGLGLWKKRF